MPLFHSRGISTSPAQSNAVNKALYSAQAAACLTDPLPAAKPYVAAASCLMLLRVLFLLQVPASLAGWALLNGPSVAPYTLGPNYGATIVDANARVIVMQLG